MPKNFWDTKQSPIMVAHRGGDGAGLVKENTLKAFAAAAKLGYEYGETDVVLSADGQVMAFHGSRNRVDSLFKKRRVPRPVLQRMTHQQIGQKVSVDGEKVPLLKEVLEAQPDMKFFIDPKTEEVVEPLYELLKQLDVFDRVCVNSFNYQRIVSFKELAVEQPVHLGLIVGRGVRLRNKNLARLRSGKFVGLEYVHLHHSLVSREMISFLHARKLKAMVWTCNTPLSIKNALNCGADGIISDRAALLKSVIDEAQSTVTKSTK